MKNIVPIFCIALCWFANGGQAFQADFSENGADKLFEDTDGNLPVVSQGKLALPSSVTTRSFPVEPRKKTKLQIRAEVDGDFVVEKNHRAHILTLQSHLHQLSSTFSVIFENANGEEICGLGNTATGGFFATNEAQPYVSVFYVPDDAVALKVRFQSNGRKTYIRDFSLSEETEENTVNPNPDFRYGELNYSGWRPGRDGRLYKRPDGKTVFNGGIGGTSAFFPLDPKERYHVVAVGEDSVININYLDKDGKNIVSRFLVRPTQDGASIEFTPPPGTTMGNLVINRGILEEIKLTKMK